MATCHYLLVVTNEDAIVRPERYGGAVPVNCFVSMAQESIETFKALAVSSCCNSKPTLL
jgi:hypothetical protein